MKHCYFLEYRLLKLSNIIGLSWSMSFYDKYLSYFVPGEVLVCEESLSSVVQFDERMRLYCGACLRRVAAPLPCPRCSLVGWVESCRESDETAARLMHISNYVFSIKTVKGFTFSVRWCSAARPVNAPQQRHAPELTQCSARSCRH